MNKLFKTWMIFSKTIFSDSTGCRRRKYGYDEKSKPNRIRYKKVFRQIFPPEDNYVLDILQSDEFKAFLINDATTTQGWNAIAKHFGVDEEWENVKSKATPVEQYYQGKTPQIPCVSVFATPGQ